jgi:4-amino-4-deoxy-L-arabinose transferase-like glycosyltransferase
MNRKPRSSLEWALMTLILLVAALFRFHDLGNAPKGLEHDEVATWHMVVHVMEGNYPIYFEEGYGHEPLFNYLTAIPMSIWGQNWLGERFWAPWFGMFAVAATYALMRRMFSPLIGLSAASFQATVLWALFFNRLGLRLNQLPFLLCVTAYCFWRGVEMTSCRPQASVGRVSIPDEPATSARADSPIPPFAHSRTVWFAAAGVLMGLCFYTYMSSRVVPLIFGAFTAYLIAHDLWISRPRSLPRTGWRQLIAKWWPVVICFAVAASIMAPLVLYLFNRPPMTNIPQRESQVDRPLRELLKGNVQPILENAWGLLKMWNVDGERYWQLNYAHRPVFVEPISGLLFWIGALLIIWHWKDPRMALLILWIGLGMVPSLITSEAPSWPRTMLASPAALTLPGIAVATIREWSQVVQTGKPANRPIRTFIAHLAKTSPRALCFSE